MHGWVARAPRSKLEEGRKWLIKVRNNQRTGSFPSAQTLFYSLKVNEFDAVFIPGGFGAAKNLSDFAVSGADMSVDLEVQ